MSAAIGPVITKGYQSAGCVDIHAIFFMSEMRAAGAASRQNQISFAAVGGNPDQIVVLRLAAIEAAVFAVVGIAAEQYNARAIGRKDGIAVDGERFRELYGSATRRGNLPKLPAFAGPGDIGDPLAVRRKRRLERSRFSGVELLRFSRREIECIEMSHRRKGKLFAVKRFGGVVNESHLDRTLVYLLREIEFGAEVLGDFGGKRNDGFGGGVEVQAADFTVLVVNDFLAARQEGVTREKVAGKDGFLIVAGDRIADPVVFAGFEIA